MFSCDVNLNGKKQDLSENKKNNNDNDSSDDEDSFWYQTWLEDGTVKITNSSRKSSTIFSNKNLNNIQLGDLIKVTPHKKEPLIMNNNTNPIELPKFKIGIYENDEECEVPLDMKEVTPDDESTIIHDEHHVPKLLKVGDGSFTKILSATELASEVKKQSETASHIPSHPENESKVLVLYTGGTIGMKCHDGVYIPEPNYLPKAIYQIPHLNDKSYVNKFYGSSKIRPFTLPPVRKMQKRVVYWVVEYEPLLDSSDMTFDDWIRIAKDIKKSYHQYDGFVILHGTDTLAYTACALSFMMENLGKPVVITGAQIPVSEVRSDGRENLIGALIVAGNIDVPEVTVYFNNKLLRGNRCTKLDNSGLEAFTSPNMLPLAEMQIDVKVSYESIFRSHCLSKFNVHDHLCRNINILRIFPSIAIESVKASLQQPIEGVILQTYGAGNMPSRRLDIIEELKKANDRGVLIVNVSQCYRGQVDANYLTGKILYDVGVIPGSDMTAEAALTKLAYVLSKDDWDLRTKRRKMEKNLRGEITVSSKHDCLYEIDIITRLTKFLRITSSNEAALLRSALLPPLVCYGADTNDLKLLESLYESGANFGAPDYNQKTGLHVACSQGNRDAVEYFLKCGANIHAKDVNGDTPLICAIRSKNYACVKLLRQAGAVLPNIPMKIGVELCMAARSNDLVLLKIWHEAGAKMTEKDYDGKCALDIAEKFGDPDTVQYLKEMTLHEDDD
uniref:asparaginase n=1 Tax=Parastrongyloides trichosuri TaxID=131310 RepID=A0A0N4Z4L7_PARTI